MEFLYLLNALNRRKWIIIGSVIVALLAAYVLTRNIQKQYKSVAQISTGFTSSDALRLNDERYNYQQAEIKFNNVIENFTSPKVLNLLSYDLMLHDLTQKPPFKQVNPDEKGHEGLKKLSPQAAAQLLQTKRDQFQLLNKDVPEEKAVLDYIRAYGYDVESLNKQLLVARVPRTDYINLTFTSSNPELSAYALNTLVQKFEDYYNQNKLQRSDTSIATLDSMVNGKKAELDRRVAAKTSFMAAHGIVDVGLQGSSALQQKGTLENQLSREQANREQTVFEIQQLNQQISQAKSGNGTTTTTGSSNDNLTYVSLKNQYRNLYREYVDK